jgi:hypothetical protein
MTPRKSTALTEEQISAKWELFGPPPVLSSENKEGYHKLRNAYVTYYRPTNDRHWAWIRELVDTQWEILRHLRYRTAAIERYQQMRMRVWRKKCKQIVEMNKNQLSKLYLPFGDSGHEGVLSLQAHIATLEATIQEVEQRKPDDVEHSGDLESAAKYAEKLDKWLKNGTARRNNLLKILEYFCRSGEQEAEIPAVDYHEVVQDEVKQIGATPILPLALAADMTKRDSVPGRAVSTNRPVNRLDEKGV